MNSADKFNEFFKNKVVLVTGHTGFKGAWLSIWLHHLGAKVIGYSLNPLYENSLFELSKIGEKIVDIRADIRDFSKLNSIFEIYKPEIVIHLAAQAIVRTSYDFPLDTFSTNILGTANVLECSKRHNVKSIVSITSDKCYKNVEQEEGYVETDLFSDQDPYSASKGCAEMIAQCYRHSFGLKVATARAGNVVGGGDWAKDRLIPDIIRALNKNEVITIRNPNSTRPWQFVLEPLRGYLLLAKKQYEGQILNEGFNFGPDRLSIINVEEIVKLMIKKFGSGHYIIQKDLSEKKEAGLLFLDCKKADDKIGWKTKLNIEEVIDYVIEWYKNYKNTNVYSLCVNQIERYNLK